MSWKSVLMVGDSLLWGWHSQGQSLPPGRILTALDGTQVYSLACPGAVLGQGNVRQKCLLDVVDEHFRTNEEKYDAAVVLAGVNDLAGDDLAEEVFVRLGRLCERLRDHGLRVFVLTVPRLCQRHSWEKHRMQYNDHIRSLSQVTVVDAAKHLEALCQIDSAAHAALFDPDGLHLSSLGYVVVALLLRRSLLLP